MNDLFKARDVLKVGKKNYTIYRLDALEKAGLTEIKRLPFSIRIMLEAALRQCDGKGITEKDVRNIAAWKPQSARPGISFLPVRVIMQDFTGVPAMVDLAAMRGSCTSRRRPEEDQSAGAGGPGHRPFRSSGFLRHAGCLTAQHRNGISA